MDAQINLKHIGIFCCLGGDLALVDDAEVGAQQQVEGGFCVVALTPQVIRLLVHLPAHFLGIDTENLDGQFCKMVALGDARQDLHDVQPGVFTDVLAHLRHLLVHIHRKAFVGQQRLSREKADEIAQVV